MRALILAAVLAGCTPQPTLSTHTASLTGAGGCFDPVTFGATPDDHVSDRVAIQSAIDAATGQPNGGTVCIGPGVWDLERAPIGTYNRYAALSTHGKGLTLRCAGPESVLSITGDQGGQSTVLFSIDPSAEQIAIDGCTLRGRGMSNTHEQTHAIITSGVCSGETCKPISDVTIRNVTCDWPYDGPWRKGDCVKLLGNTSATEVYRVRIIGNDLSGARSAIVLQRGLHDVVIADNTLHCDRCDQVIDGEATGGGWDLGITITGNTITAGPDAQGDFDLALVSTRWGAVTGNKLSRGMALYRTEGVTVTGNTIMHTARSNAATVAVSNACDGLIVSGNAIRRGGSPGPVVKLEPASGVACNGAVLSSNALTQDTAHVAIMVSSTSRLVITGNQITHTVAAPGYASIYALSGYQETPITALKISDNTIYGPATYAVTLEGSPGYFGQGVSLTGNVAVGQVFGLRCKNPAFFSSPVTYSGNAIGPGSYTVPVSSGSP